MSVREHPFVMKIVHELAVGYEDALSLLRGRKDADSVQAVAQIDTERATERQRAEDLNIEMAGRLGMDVREASALASRLAADPELETWLLRRVNLERAHGVPPSHDEHPENA